MCKFASNRFHGTRGSRDDGFRKVHGFTTRIHADKQGKHIPGHKNYIPGRSVLHLSIAEVQKLVEEYAGTGIWKGESKELIEFSRTIGTWVKDDGSQRAPTTRGFIHYSKTGCHVVPSRPRRKDEQ